MKKLLESKEKVIGIMVAILIVSGMVGIGIGIKYQKSIYSQQALAIANENEKVEKEESEYYKEELKKIKQEFISSTQILYGETKEKTDFNFSLDSKKKMAAGLGKINNVLKERDNLKEPKAVRNIKIYKDIRDICDKINEFKSDFVYGIDYKSSSDIQKAADELKEINKMMNDNELIQ